MFACLCNADTFLRRLCSFKSCCSLSPQVAYMAKWRKINKCDYGGTYVDLGKCWLNCRLAVIWWHYYRKPLHREIRACIHRVSSNYLKWLLYIQALPMHHNQPEICDYEPDWAGFGGYTMMAASLYNHKPPNITRLYISHIHQVGMWWGYRPDSHNHGNIVLYSS